MSHLGDRVAAFVDGALDVRDAERVRAHLAGCPGCRAQVVEQRRVRDLLRGSTAQQVAVDPSLLAALVSMPRDGVPPPHVVAPVASSRPRHLGLWGSASGVAVGVTVLATAWAVGAPAAVGAAAVPAERLVEQHDATAGELPFWGNPAEVSPAALGQDGVRLLQRAAGASTSVSFRGTEVVTRVGRGGPTTSLREISHSAGHGTATRRVDATGAPGAGDFRPQRATSTTVGVDAIGLLARSYRVDADGTGFVAGRSADRVAVTTLEGQPMAVFWLDRATGLPLARELRDPSGAQVRGSTFTDVSLADPRTLPRHLPVATTAVWADVAAGEDLVSLEAQGWVCPAELASALGLEPFDARLTSGTSSPVLHLVYTDGLRSVSVFQQRAAASAALADDDSVLEVEGFRVHRIPAETHGYTWVSGVLVFTVVGDAGLVERAVAVLPHETDGTSERAVRGLSRVGSWFDPFG
ncbi:MAG TPA: zf-HC2 domain-containing protein [Ornithinibacter sp.]|nr:zf-HC2 domain-containing protein [Ornithinibacter sp.]